VDPKPKPKQGQTQEQNEQEFAEQLTLKGFEMDSPEEEINGIELTFKPHFNCETYTTSQYDGSEAVEYPEFTTTNASPVYLDPSDNVVSDNVVHSFTWAEHKHEEMRKRYPALEKAYDHYKTLLALAQNGPEDLDN
jgi:hypothetical protein